MIYTSTLPLILFILAILPSLHQQMTKSNSGPKAKVIAPTVYKTYDQCNFTLVSPKKVINPYKADLTNFVPQKPFGSVYLKCAACLAIADQISTIINTFISKSVTSQTCKHSVDQEVSNKVNELCTKGFKNYDLRKCNEINIITDKFSCTEHVKSNMDGGWTRKLRELCNLYTSRMDLSQLRNIYANGTNELSTHLCRGSGIFRDCQNLEDDTQKDLGELCEKCGCINKCEV